MSLDTTKSIKSITYNGTEIPLASTASGDTSETWVLNDPITNNITDAVASLATPEFTVEGISYTGFAIQRVRLDLYFNYVNSNTSTQAMYLGLADVGYSFIRWNNQAYRKLTFATPPTGELLTWLQANGVKQEKNLAIQPSKNLTITSNGTTMITPDVPYDAMGQVGVTVNVASSGGSGETTSLQVTTMSDNVEAPIFCLWQTNDGWTGTSNFDSVTDFTVPNVIVGGYVIFTHDPATTEWHFICAIPEGVEPISVDGMDPEYDTSNAALVIKVTALSPSFRIRLMSV